MTRPNQAEQDPVRRKILAAMDRLLDGTPLRSTGRMSVSQLAVEAGLERWHLTHQNVDLKELFQARVKAADSTPAVFAREPSELEEPKKTQAQQLVHCTELEERLALRIGDQCSGAGEGGRRHWSARPEPGGPAPQTAGIPSRSAMTW